eukprot:2712224-Pleurochrysis_carterae.AAC.1
MARDKEIVELKQQLLAHEKNEVLRKRRLANVKNVMQYRDATLKQRNTELKELDKKLLLADAEAKRLQREAAAAQQREADEKQ